MLRISDCRASIRSLFLTLSSMRFWMDSTKRSFSSFKCAMASLVLLLAFQHRIHRDLVIIDVRVNLITLCLLGLALQLIAFDGGFQRGNTLFNGKKAAFLLPEFPVYRRIYYRPTRFSRPEACPAWREPLEYYPEAQEPCVLPAEPSVPDPVVLFGSPEVFHFRKSCLTVERIPFQIVPGGWTGLQFYHPIHAEIRFLLSRAWRNLRAGSACH